MTDEDPLAGLDFDIIEPNVQDLTKLTDFELSDLDGNVETELHELGEMHNPRSSRARELHSTYTAIQIEKRRRGW